MDLKDIAIGGVDLILVIVGLMEFAKKLGLAGKSLIVSAFVVLSFFGAVAGAISEGLVPEMALPWIRVVVYALYVAVNGAAAMGLYDVSKKFRPVAGELLETEEERHHPLIKIDASGKIM